jgi:hypothetical protein
MGGRDHGRAEPRPPGEILNFARRRNDYGFRSETPRALGDGQKHPLRSAEIADARNVKDAAMEQWLTDVALLGVNFS